MYKAGIFKFDFLFCEVRIKFHNECILLLGKLEWYLCPGKNLMIESIPFQSFTPTKWRKLNRCLLSIFKFCLCLTTCTVKNQPKILANGPDNLHRSPERYMISINIRLISSKAYTLVTRPY